jgi:hypothetical protein
VIKAAGSEIAASLPHRTAYGLRHDSGPPSADRSEAEKVPVIRALPPARDWRARRKKGEEPKIACSLAPSRRKALLTPISN